MGVCVPAAAHGTALEMVVVEPKATEKGKVVSTCAVRDPNNVITRRVHEQKQGHTARHVQGRLAVGVLPPSDVPVPVFLVELPFGPMREVYSSDRICG